MECLKSMNNMMPKLEFNNIDKTLTEMDNIDSMKSPSEIKTENRELCPERENSNDSQSTCLNCHNLQKKLKISRGWNRFYREKVINVDKVLHIISEFEREKQKNLELQLAYDQRSREWAQQQEQLINLLTEVQPLREKLRITEEALQKEMKERQKHQYMEESLKITIQQLQAKITHMNTIANPIFVENLEKKLNISRSESKKIKCNLEFKKAEVAELRSFITDKNIQVENISKKLYWAFQLANKYFPNASEDNENSLEKDILLHHTENILRTLKAMYSTFYEKKKKECREKQLPLALVPNFAKWVADFEKKEIEEDTQDEDFVIKKEEIIKIEKEASQLEMLLSNVTVEEVFENINKHEPVPDYSLQPPPPLSEDQMKDSKQNKSKRNSTTRRERGSLKNNSKHSSPSPKKRCSSKSLLENSVVDSISKNNRNSLKRQRKHISSSPKKVVSKSALKKQDNYVNENNPKISSISKLEDNCTMFKSLMDKSLKAPNKPTISSPNKSSKRRSSKKLNPKTPEFVKRSMLSDDLHLSDSSFISDSSESDDDEKPLSEISKLSSENNSNIKKRLTHPLGKEILSNKSNTTTSTLTTTTNKNNNDDDNIVTDNSSDSEETKRIKDSEELTRIIIEMTDIPPLNHVPYSDDTDSSSDHGSQSKCTNLSKETSKACTSPNSPASNVPYNLLNSNIDSRKENRAPPKSQIETKTKALKTRPIKTKSPKRKLSNIINNDDKCFVPQRVTRSSYKRQKLPVETKPLHTDKVNEDSLPNKESSIFSSDNETDSKESHFVCPSPVRPQTRSRHSSANFAAMPSPTHSSGKNPKSHPTSDATYKDIALDLNLSISSSNTDTEEGETNKSEVNLGPYVSSNYLKEDLKESYLNTSSPASLNSEANQEKSDKKDTLEKGKNFESPIENLDAENNQETCAPDKYVEENSDRELKYQETIAKDDSLEKDAPDKYIEENSDRELNYQETIAKDDGLEKGAPDKYIEENSDRELNYQETIANDDGLEKDAPDKYIEENSDSELNYQETIAKDDGLEKGAPEMHLIEENSDRELKYQETIVKDDGLEKDGIREVNTDIDKNDLLICNGDEAEEATVILPISSSVKKLDVKPVQNPIESQISEDKVICEMQENISLENASAVTSLNISTQNKISDLNHNEDPYESEFSQTKINSEILEDQTSLEKSGKNPPNISIFDDDVLPKNPSPLEIVEDISNSETLSGKVSSEEGKTLEIVEDISNSETLSAKVPSEAEKTLEIVEDISNSETLSGKISSEGGKTLEFVEDISNSETLSGKVSSEAEKILEIVEDISSSETLSGKDSSEAEKTLEIVEDISNSETLSGKDSSEAEKILSPEIKVEINKSGGKRKCPELFSNEPDEFVTSESAETPLETTVSESPLSLTLSSSFETNDDCNLSLIENDLKKSNIRDSLLASGDEDEGDLVMDILDDMPHKNESSGESDAPDDDFNYIEVPRQDKQLNISESKVQIESDKFNGSNDVTVQQPEPSSFSFYKERQDFTEKMEFHIPNFIFGEDSTEDNVTGGNPSSQQENKKQSKDKEKTSSKGGRMARLPQIRTHPEFPKTILKLEDMYMNSETLQEYFQDVLGCHVAGSDWNQLVGNIISYVDDIKAPNMATKLQPLVRNLLVNVLRSSPYEKRDSKHTIPPTIYKLFLISRILEEHLHLPTFALDSLVNVTAHKLILTKKLRPISLSSLTTWVISSCHAQYNKLKKPADEESLRWARCFLIDLLFHHKGLVHESLLAAVASSKKVFLRIVKYRQSTSLEKLIYWIGHHGDWDGPKVTRTTLIQEFKRKLGLMKGPPLNMSDVLKSILLILINNEADKNELASSKAAFLLYLKWTPVAIIIKSLFPQLKNVYYENVIINKPSLDDLKCSIESFAKKVAWEKETEDNFLYHLKCFPIIKN